MKRMLAWILVAVLLFSSSASSFVFAEEYTIPDISHSENGDYVTREEAVAAFVRAIGMDTSRANTRILSQFTDASKIASNYTREIAAAVATGMVSGYEDATFRPQKQISRVEALVILNRVLAKRTLPQHTDLSFFDTPTWAEEEINRLSAAGVVQGYGNGYLGASDPLTREQTNLLAERAARMAGPTGNYYEFANEDWLFDAEIPQGLNAWSEISGIQQDLMKEIGNIIYPLYRQQNKENAEFKKGSSEQKIVDVFTAGANTVYRDSLELKPVQKYLAMIDSVKNTQDLLTVMAKLERYGFHGLLPLSIGTDIKDSSRYVLTFSECYTGMNVDMVQSDEKASAADAYQSYITSLFELFELSNPQTRAEKVTDLCRRLAESSLSLEELEAFEDHYQLSSVKDLNNIFTNLDIRVFLDSFGFAKVENLAVYDVNLAKAVNEIFTQDNLALLKDYLRASVMDASALSLNTDAFLIWRTYQDTLNGTHSQALPADYAVQNVEELLGWDLAKLYVESYPNDGAIAAVKTMTEEILDAYQKRIRKNNWLSNEGKQSALKKLENLQIRVGYPEDIATYPDEDYEIKSIKDGGNLLEYRTAYCDRHFDTALALILGKSDAHDKDTWSMLPFTVNAMYEPSSNSITIPMGILREPFYDPNASREWNLGGIGSVIAHEISHALDAIGSQFDENGNLNQGWQEEDHKVFAAICQQVENAYGSIEFLPDIYINGTATLSENMADLAGMACVLDVAGSGNPRLEDVFLGYASIWRILANDNYYQTMLKSDAHAPDKVRVNRVLSNFDVFLNFYNIQPGDGMYLPQNERIQIWNR